MVKNSSYPLPPPAANIIVIISEPADGIFYSLTVFLDCNFNLQQNLLKNEIPMYVKLYFSDIMKDLENQPPPQNQTDVIISGYQHLLPFATTG